ncbi:MAG: 23S rRNA (uracil(1939)-C(5))-methyltransferase RlmD [Velocimicrobium sp.]
MNKNDEFIISIEDMTSDGEGIGRKDGFALFVKDTIKGDLVTVKVIKMKKTYGFARLIEIIEPSSHRVEPRCPLSRKCGGCQIMHCSYEKQLEYKENKVRNCLERIGKLTNLPMEPIMGMEEPYYYRNKAQFPVGRNREGKIEIGFYAGHTHSIVDTSHCYIQAPINEQLIQIIRDFLEEFHIEPYDEASKKGLVRHILTRVGDATGEIMVCLVINARKLPHADKLIERLSKVEGMTSIMLNVNQENTNVILGKESKNLWGQNYITDCIGTIKYQISPLSFYQVNPTQTKKLYETALEYADLHGEEIVWDIYCGIGTISLFLAQSAKQVYGVEIVPEAIEDAKRNAALNQIGNAEFFVGAAEDVLPEKYAKSNGAMRADVIVIDPPRKGCDEVLLDTIVKMEPDRIVYVSCDPATLARDLRYLEDHGYQVKRVRACDMFAHSVHVETVILMTRCGLNDK